MKIALASDIHLEFGDIDLKNTENANVLILGGDICVAADIGKPDRSNIIEGVRSNRITNFFKRCSSEFQHVVYIMGNHEHYHGDFASTGSKFKSLFETHGLANIYFLDKEVKVIDDVTFIGGTLWTDMNNEDPITMLSMRQMMNDFRCVDNSNCNTHTAYFSPEDAIDDHRKMIDYIRIVVEGHNEKKFIVVGHHAPTKLSTHPRYADEKIINGGYSSDLSEFIADRPQIKLWTHGHTHDPFDYMIGSTRIVCNPRGYITYEENADKFELQYIEI